MRFLPALAAAVFLGLAMSGCLGSETPAADAPREPPTPHSPSDEPVSPMQLFDRLDERPAGIEREVRFLSEPIVIPPGQDLNRATVQIPVREGFMTAVSPRLFDASTGITPSNQHMHIHHAHWLKPTMDAEDETYAANLAWVFGTGEERTQGSLHDRAEADPNGPRYGIYLQGSQTGAPPVEPQVLIFMLHNKMAEPRTLYVALDVSFVYGSAEAIAAAKDCPGLMEGEACQAGRQFHNLQGRLWGSTFDVARHSEEDGGKGTYVYPIDAPESDPTRQSTDALGRMFTATHDATAVAAAGHLHPNGMATVVANLGPEGSACEADLDGDGLPGVTLLRSTKMEEVPEAWPHSEQYQMGATKHGWRAPIREGDRITQFAFYDNGEYASYEAMTFVGLYMDREQAPAARGAEGCTLENTQASLLPGDPWGGDPVETVVNRDPHAGHGEPSEYCGILDYPPCDTEMPKPERGLAAGVVHIAGFLYTPGDRALSGQAGLPVQVTKGSDLMFINDDVALGGVRHTVTSCEWPCNGRYVANYPNPDGIFDSGKMGNTDPIDGGGVVTSGGPLFGAGLSEDTSPVWTLDTSDLDAGLYAYYCRIHPWMRGSIEVV
ncbi:MAG: cupredoxin domain-containing protein [Thermoplasmatota archaeon]